MALPRVCVGVWGYGLSHAELLADAAAKVVESHRHPSWDYRLPERFRGGSGTQGDPAAAVIGAHESPASDSAGLLAARRIGFRSSLLSSGGPEPVSCDHWWMYGGRCYYCGKERIR